ncbi:MAG: LacI family DNA-binding transcriptional regulator, partial [Pseudomonadota bacterium]
RDLAARLQLSQTTVSRALNGYPEVSEDTRRRVVEAARELDYKPNSYARRLATGKAGAIGHVVPLGEHDMMNPHFTDFIAAAGVVYNSRGYDMLLSVVEEDKEIDAYRALRRDSRVDGVIVHGPMRGDKRVDILKDLGVPFVVHGRVPDREPDYPWVDVNNREAFAEATAFLTGLGHSRVALINGLESMAFAIDRKAGFIEGLRQSGLDADQRLMATAEMTEPNGYAAMNAMLRVDLPPTGVVCSSMLVALGAMRAIRELGMKVGVDISLITHDDCLSFLGTGRGELDVTSTRSSLKEAGTVCAGLLLDIIDGKANEQSVLLNAELVVGTTTAAAPLTPA